MAYAIYYFKDNSVEVGKINWMKEEDQKDASSKKITGCPDLADEDGWKEVKWNGGKQKKKGGQATFPAKILMLGGK